MFSSVWGFLIIFCFTIGEPSCVYFFYLVSRYAPPIAAPVKMAVVIPAVTRPAITKVVKPAVSKMSIEFDVFMLFPS